MSQIVNTHLRAAVKGTTLVFLGSLISLPLWLVTKVLIIRVTTKEEFGIYSLALAIVSIISILATLGIQEGATRFIAVFLGQGKRGDADAISISAIRISLISGTISFLTLFLLSGAAAQYVFYMPELSAPLKVISLYIPFFILSTVIGAVLRAHNIIRPKVYYLDIGQPLYFLACLGVILFLSPSLMSIIYAYLIAAMMVFVSISVYGYKKIGLNPFLKKGNQAADLLKFSFPLVIGSIANMVLVWTDTMMLGRYTTAGDVGVYNVSISLARLISIGLAAMGFVFMPIAGEMYAKGQQFELKRTYQVLTKWVFFLMLPTFFVLFFFPEMSITFLFGERYIVSSTSLRILSIGFLFHVFLGTNAVLLVVRGLSKEVMKVAVFGAVMNIALNYLLIKRLDTGITGAAIATSVSYVALNLINSYLLYRESRIHPLTAQYIKPVVGSSLAALLIYAVAKGIPFYLWMLPLYFVLFFGAYALSLLLTKSLEREDVELFEAVSAKTGLRMAPIRKILRKYIPIENGLYNGKN